MDVDAFETPRHGNSVIPAAIVHQDNGIDQLLLADFGIGLA